MAARAARLGPGLALGSRLPGSGHMSHALARLMAPDVGDPCRAIASQAGGEDGLELAAGCVWSKGQEWRGGRPMKEIACEKKGDAAQIKVRPLYFTFKREGMRVYAYLDGRCPPTGVFAMRSQGRPDPVRLRSSFSTASPVRDCLPSTPLKGVGSLFIKDSRPEWH